jgi:RluA family pseudouridine synthase
MVLNSSEMIVTPAEARGTLLDFLAARLSLSRRGAKALLDARNVFVNRERIWMARHALRAGDRVTVMRESAAPRHPPRLMVLHQDAGYLIVDKPPGILANGRDSAEELLRAQSGIPTLLAVHRLDRDTSGCLLCAVDRDAFEAAVALFKGHCVRKAYHVLALGDVKPAERRIAAPLEGLPAATLIRVLSSNRNASHLLATIETGRTHQIRKHLSLIRHPVLGDRQYGTREASRARWIPAPRQMLHAAEIAFDHPVTGRTVRAVAPLPADFRDCLTRLGLA